MPKSPPRRVPCPFCHKTIRVSKKGYLINHAIRGQGATEYRPLCPGSGALVPGRRP